jgi:peptidoglycan/LPS O-acetylase OafA/YrhL
MPNSAGTISSPQRTAPRLSKHIVGLDALRMIAAFIVMAGHLTYVMWLGRPEHPAIASRARPFVWYGWIGVEIFFVLSGFVIAYSAYGLTTAASGAPAHAVFLQHRLKRLLPGAFLCGTFTALLILATSPISLMTVLTRWVKTMLLLPQAPWPILHIPLVDPSYWTLSLEATFYALVYLLLRLRRIDKLPTVMATLGAVSSLHWIAFFLLHRHTPGPHPWLYPESLHALAQMTLVTNGCYFALGVFLWLCLFRGLTWQRIAIIGLCIVGGILQIIQRWNVFAGIPSTLAVFLWLLSIGLIIACTVFNQRVQLTLGHHGAIVLRRIGLMTYPLYLVHYELGKRIILAIRSTVGDWSAAGIAMASALLVAYVISKYVERPLQDLLWKFMNRRSNSKIPVQTAA